MNTGFIRRKDTDIFRNIYSAGITGIKKALLPDTDRAHDIRIMEALEKLWKKQGCAFQKSTAGY